ncbi:MAG: hypothetical protein ACOYEW_06250 [Anaerolineae bacterium]|jgi:hypothetical protein
MSRLTFLGLAFVLLLLVLPLVSLGTTGNTDILWWLGLAFLAIGGLLPPISKFVAERAAPPPGEGPEPGP